MMLPVCPIIISSYHNFPIPALQYFTLQINEYRLRIFTPEEEEMKKH